MSRQELKQKMADDAVIVIDSIEQALAALKRIIECQPDALSSKLVRTNGENGLFRTAKSHIQYLEHMVEGPGIFPECPRGDFRILLHQIKNLNAEELQVAEEKTS